MLFKGFDREAEKFMVANFGEVYEKNPFVSYDIGASGGLISLLDWELFPHQKIYGFEPIQAEYAKLVAMYKSSQKHHVYNLAVADKTGRIPFFLSKHVGTSSTFQVFEGMTKIEVDAIKLDDFVKSYEALPPDFIKIDVEGGELPALRSGHDMMESHTLCIVSEYAFWRMNENETRFSQLDSYLSENGFILFDLTINNANFSNVGGKKGKLRTGDALYIKDFKWLHETVLADFSNDELRVKLLKLVLICYRYLYVDYALEIVDYGHRVGILDDADFRVLVRELATITDASRKIPNFPGRIWLSKFLDLASYIMNISLKKQVPAVYAHMGNSSRVARRKSATTEIKIYRPVFDRRRDSHTINLDG